MVGAGGRPVLRRRLLFAPLIAPVRRRPAVADRPLKAALGAAPLRHRRSRPRRPEPGRCSARRSRCAWASSPSCCRCCTGTRSACIAGYLGGWVDGLFMRGMDIVLAFPSTLTGDRHRRHARTGPGDGAGRHRHRQHPDLCAPGALDGPVAQRARLRPGRALPGRVQAAASSAGTSCPIRSSPLIVQATLGIATAIIEAAGARLSGPGRPAARARMGPDADQRPRLSDRTRRGR